MKLNLLKDNSDNKQQRKMLQDQRKELISERSSLLVPERSYKIQFSF
ncbi:hypothetical protein VMA_003034 [Vibrio mimicus VM223]|nr:hypothetical protein VMA_003034 [Vibrio mimicus VM223]